MPERLRSSQLQVAATAFLSLFSVVGFALYGLPFFYNFMVTDLGWSRQEVTSGNFYSKLLIGPLFGFIAGWVIDRWGPRKLMLAGILMAGMALIGLSSVTTLGMFYFFYVFNALGYVCGGPLPNQVLLSRWFDKARGKAMGFAYLGIGVGGLLVPQIATRLTTSLGWQGALRTIGILMIVIALPMALFVKESPDTQPEGQRNLPPPPPVRIGPILKTVPFYLLAIGSMCSIGAVGGANQNLKLYLSLDLKYPEGVIANILTLVLASSLVGRLLMGWLADRFPKKYVMLLIYLLVAMAIPFLFFASSLPVLCLFAVLFGIGLGGDYMIIPLMAGELFGVRVLGRLMGIILTADGVAEALAPYIVGSMRDKGGAYTMGFVLLICLAAVGALAVALLPRKSSALSEA